MIVDIAFWFLKIVVDMKARSHRSEVRETPSAGEENRQAEICQTTSTFKAKAFPFLSKV